MHLSALPVPLVSSKIRMLSPTLLSRACARDSSARPTTHSRPLVSQAICTGLTSSGNCSSLAKRFTLQPLATVILRDRFFAAEEGPGLVGLRGRAGWSRPSRPAAGSSRPTASVLALRDGPDALVAVGGHHVALGHLLLHDLVVGDLRPGLGRTGVTPAASGRRRRCSRRRCGSGRATLRSCR